jgi:hypothetical protein
LLKETASSLKDFGDCVPVMFIENVSQFANDTRFQGARAAQLDRIHVGVLQ